MIKKEINKSDLMGVIEYELNYRDQVHKAEIKEILNEKNKEITAKNKENARLKAKLKEHGIKL